jgi:hypothetical protein
VIPFPCRLTFSYSLFVGFWVAASRSFNISRISRASSLGRRGWTNCTLPSNSIEVRGTTSVSDGAIHCIVATYDVNTFTGAMGFVEIFNTALTSGQVTSFCSSPHII